MENTEMGKNKKVRYDIMRIYLQRETTKGADGVYRSDVSVYFLSVTTGTNGKQTIAPYGRDRKSPSLSLAWMLAQRVGRHIVRSKTADMVEVIYRAALGDDQELSWITQSKEADAMEQSLSLGLVSE
jgi:hypothetical protein